VPGGPWNPSRREDGADGFLDKLGMTALRARPSKQRPDETGYRLPFAEEGSAMPPFTPGLRLSELFYREAVRPILDRSFPGLAHAAALLGHGSEVLGLDTARSTDHEWGPRLLLFLSEEDERRHAAAIRDALALRLPPTFRGHSTHFGPADDEGVSLPAATTGPVNHEVLVTTVPAFVADRLGVASYPVVDLLDWLVCSEQRLLEVTAGAVFHDGPGELTAARDAFRYYPDDLWRYLLASQWGRIGQQEAFVGRCGEVGDELGSALVTASLVRDLMRLGFLLERRYAPYAKWLGSAFARLAGAADLRPFLDGALAARSWRERERYLGDAYSVVAAMHNRLVLTDPLPTAVSPYHGRPFLVIHGERFAAAIRAGIRDPRVLALPPNVGSVDQFVDSTDVLSRAGRRPRLKAVFGGDAP
jgi:hypothetical protein